MSDEASSADTTGSVELKAGRAPATKVGGMRVSAPRPRHTSQGEEKNTEEGSGENAAESGATEGQEKGASKRDDNEQASNVVANKEAGQMVGGTFVPIQEAFPTEAVKHIHDKPGTHPKHEAHAHNRNDDQRFINQPRKQ